MPLSHQLGRRSWKPHKNTSKDNPQHTEEAYDSASQAILKTLQPTHNRGLKPVLEMFVMCCTENVIYRYTRRVYQPSLKCEN
jgi:hypothetical protein